MSDKRKCRVCGNEDSNEVDVWFADELGRSIEDKERTEIRKHEPICEDCIHTLFPNFTKK